jgi:MFS family permease
MKVNIITRVIWILSIVSLLTDISSEMLYPVMPVYLKYIGFSVLLIGILEGLAQAVAGLSNGYFGKLSDSSGKRLPFVRWGYFLSALSKPMMAAFTFPVWIFIARTLDRLGKGMRTSARDALLSDETTPAHKGRVFGFHRSMDTAGAVIGPVFALIFLYYYPGQYRLMFILAFLPGILSVGVTYLISKKEKTKTPAAGHLPYSFFSFFKYWKKSSPTYRKLVLGLLGFALLNSSDFFLLLMMKANGLSNVQLILVYIFYNIIYALTSYPVGILADRIGLWQTLIAGLCLFIVVYTGMAFIHSMHLYIPLFAIYGVYAAANEGISKALISNIALRKDTATAIGTFSAFNSLAALLSSSIAGFIWYTWGSKSLFLFVASGSICIVAYLQLIKPKLLIHANLSN